MAAASLGGEQLVMTTVKRVPGGLVSNWMHANLAAGDVVEVTVPAGVFCLRETDAPLVAFAGGSGITPVLSLASGGPAPFRFFRGGGLSWRTVTKGHRVHAFPEGGGAAVPTRGR